MKRTITYSRFLRFFFLSFFSLALHIQSHAATWIVTSNADSGPGTLRTILANAGTISGDNIYFNVPMTITLTSTLTITKGVNIDATVGTGWSAGNNQVTIAGNGSVANGVSLSTSGITIKGLTIRNFATNCMIVSGGANFNIKSCFFNTNATGTTANASAISQAIGIYVSGASSGGIIGGPNVGDGNVFYTAITNRTCLDIYNVSGMTSGTRIIVQGNKFGTNYAGTVNFGLANNCGIKCSYTNFVQIGGLGAGEGNQFEGSVSASSIWLEGTAGTSNVWIQGNKIGTVAVNSNYNGILLNSSPNSNITIEKNTINNCGNYGIVMPTTTYTGIKIDQNSFSNNVSGGIFSSYTAPTITSATSTKLMGTGFVPNDYIDIYVWDNIGTVAQGTTWLVKVLVDGAGNWSHVGSFTVGSKILVTSTPFSGNPSTTPFSSPATVINCPSTANAGADQTICATSPSLVTGGSATNCTGYSWSISGGSGTLSSYSIVNPTYNLSATEQSNTTAPIFVTLTLTAINATCAAIVDQKIVTINPKPVVATGTNQTLCANANSVALIGAMVTNATGGTWSGGGGTFSNANSLTSSYIPSAGEKVAGTNIVLTLASTGNGLCNAVTNTKTISITAAPTINIGTNQSVCANTFPMSNTAAFTVATGVNWTNGSGFTSTSPTISYQPSAAELSAGSFILTAITTGNGTCTAVSASKTITITPAPTISAGADQTFCVPSGTISLAGSVTVATGGQWTTTGGGTLTNPTSLTGATYIPSTAENNTSTTLNINFTLVSTGNATCNAVSDVMVLKLSPLPTVNAESDRTICSTNSNVLILGKVVGAPISNWTTSGSGTFLNPASDTTMYTPSNADKTAGSVTLTLTSGGGGCAGITDAMVLTINPCYIDPQLSFETPTLFKNNGATPFKHNFERLRSTGAITYAIATPTSCATISPDGFVTTSCVGTIVIKAFQAVNPPYDADTASYTLTIGKGITRILLESRGAQLTTAPFQLQVKTNYDQALTYSIVGGDPSTITLNASTGVITPVALGTVIIRAEAAGSTNFQSALSNDASVTIYPTLTPPMAIRDTISMFIAEEKSINIAENDYGTTGSINLSPSLLIDIDAENPGLQNKYFRPGVGYFIVDSIGVLTFTAFQAFIGLDSIQYTITDEYGSVSEKASFVFRVNSPVAEIALKANEIITANGDNLNNALVIGYTDLTQENDLLVVDAAGNRLYYVQNYQNNWSATDSSGNNLGSGVYYFIFREFTSSGSVRRQLKGNFTLIR